MVDFLNNLRGKITRKDSLPRTTSNAPKDTISAVSSLQSAPRGKREGDLTERSRSARKPAQVQSRSMTHAPYNDPPPAYSIDPPRQQGDLLSVAPTTARSAPRSHSSSSARSSASVRDDRYAFLRSFDTAFLIDDSGSMAGRSWRETAAALESITPICTSHDADGVDIYFLNAKDSEWFHHVRNPATVREIFNTIRPQGGTPMGQRLDAILRPYLQRYATDPGGTKPLNIIVITDGVPSDDVESPLISCAKKLDKLDAPAWQVGIQFFQVGNEPDARKHLKQLDDDLAEIAGDHELRDMIDTVPFTGDNNAELSAEGILKVVLGACNRRLDRKSADLYRRR